jgi:hypothetical protein
MIAEINELVESLGMSPIVTTVVTLILGAAYKYRDHLYNLVNNKTSLSTSLGCHDLFSTITMLRDINLRAISFKSGPSKTRAFKDFMECKFNSIEFYSKKLISDRVYKKSHDQFADAVKNALTNIVKDYTQKATAKFLKKGLTSDQAEHVINMFNTWHDDTLKSVISRTDSILENNFYSSNFQKLVAVYEVIAMASELTLSDGVKSFEKLNGYFKNIDYK